MKRRSNSSRNAEQLRKSIIGMGDNSARKSYFPVLKKRMAELERYHALLDQTYDGIAFLSFPDLIISEENSTARKIIPELKIKNQKFTDFLKEEKDRVVLQKWLHNNSESKSVSFRCKRCHPEVIDIHVVIFTLTKVIFNNEMAITLVIRDISRQVKIEEELRQSQKMDAIGQLAGGIAHDFNNALAGIMNAAELLHLKMEPESQSMEYAGIILNAAENAASLAGKLLSFSRKNDVQLETVNIHKVVEDVIGILKHCIDKQIIIEKDLTALNPFVTGDYSQLQSAFLNIGINARDAMPEGGKIIFISRECELSEMFCKDSSFDITPGNYLHISIEDTGSGMDKEVLSKIFDPFFTTKESGKGTGLGLSVLYGTIKEHHGAVKAYSEKGMGTCFNIFLPSTNQTTSIVKNEEQEYPSAGATILLVDDDDLVLSTATYLLEEEGYHVITAINGNEAVQIFREQENLIDLVLMDVVMPEKGGVDAFRIIHEQNSSMPVVLASGFSGNIQIEQLISEGVRAFVQKPYRLKNLREVLVKAIN